MRNSKPSGQRRLLSRGIQMGGFHNICMKPFCYTRRTKGTPLNVIIRVQDNMSLLNTTNMINVRNYSLIQYRYKNIFIHRQNYYNFMSFFLNFKANDAFCLFLFFPFPPLFFRKYKYRDTNHMWIAQTFILRFGGLIIQAAISSL